MRTFLKISCLMSALVLGSQALAITAPVSSQPINKIVAIVNSTPITQVQVDQLLQTAPAGQTPSQAMALQSLINETLELDVAKRAGISVSDDDVNKAIANIAKQNHMSVADMKQKILATMSWEQYTKQIKKQITLTKVQQQAVAGKVSVTHKEVNDFIRDHSDQLGLQQKFQYSDLLIPVSDKVTQTKALAYAKQIKSLWKPGVDLNTLNQKLPAIANSSMLLDSKWQTPDNIPDIFISHLNKLKNGQLSTPIITGNGIHILQLTNKSVPSAQNQQQRAIEILSQQAFMKAVKDWVKGLRSTAYVKIINA